MDKPEIVVNIRINNVNKRIFIENISFLPIQMTKTLVQLIGYNRIRVILSFPKRETDYRVSLSFLC